MQTASERVYPVASTSNGRQYPSGAKTPSLLSNDDKYFYIFVTLKSASSFIYYKNVIKITLQIEV